MPLETKSILAHIASNVIKKSTHHDRESKILLSNTYTRTGTVEYDSRFPGFALYLGQTFVSIDEATESVVHVTVT